jgi:diguanylate cyclase (GGDEF)-like protein
VLLAGQAVVALENARLHRIVEREALVDELTGLANRRQAERALDVEISRATRFGSPLSAVVIDLDDFKSVNDIHGHQAGDAVLRELADVLRDGLRQFDVASRWGGEEFLVVLPGTDAEGAEHVAKRLRVSLARRVIRAPSGAEARVTASFGVAALESSAGRDELVRRADAALYQAKRAGKNCVVVGTQPAAMR